MRRRGRRVRQDPVPLGAALDEVLSELGFEGTQRALQITRYWPEVVGEQAALHAAPLALRGEVLEVTVDSSVWCQQLALRREEILAGLRAVLGDGAPSDLRLRVG